MCGMPYSVRVMVTSYDGVVVWAAVLASAGTASVLRQAAATRRGRRLRMVERFDAARRKSSQAASVLGQQLHRVAGKVAEVEAAQVTVDVGFPRLPQEGVREDRDVLVEHALVRRVVVVAVDKERVVL